MSFAPSRFSLPPSLVWGGFTDPHSSPPSITLVLPSRARPSYKVGQQHENNPLLTAKFLLPTGLQGNYRIIPAACGTMWPKFPQTCVYSYLFLHPAILTHILPSPLLFHHLFKLFCGVTRPHTNRCNSVLRRRGRAGAGGGASVLKC